MYFNYLRDTSDVLIQIRHSINSCWLAIEKVIIITLCYLVNLVSTLTSLAIVCWRQ